MKKTIILAVFIIGYVFSIGYALAQDDKDFRTGLKYYNSKNYKAAVKYFKGYLSTKPDPRAYYFTGYALYKLGRFDESEEFFREAFLIDPEFSLEKAGLMTKRPEHVSQKDVAPKKDTAPAPEKANTTEKTQVKEAPKKK